MNIIKTLSRVGKQFMAKEKCFNEIWQVQAWRSLKVFKKGIQ